MIVHLERNTQLMFLMATPFVKFLALEDNLKDILTIAIAKILFRKYNEF